MNDPAALQAEFDRANLALQQGRLDAAVEAYGRVLALRPDFAEARSNFGVALAAQGRLAEAAAQYRHALALNPNLADTWRNLGRVLLAQGDAAQALAAARSALAIAETVETRAFFVLCARSQTAVPTLPGFAGLIARALDEGWSRPSDLSALAAELFKLGPNGKTAFAGGPAALDAMAGDPLLRALMQSAPVRDIEIEAALTSARVDMLGRALQPDAASVADDALAFPCALARQCFINDYVFAQSDAEAQQAAHLQSTSDAALASGTPVPPLQLAVLAAYRPLHGLDNAQRLLQRPWPPALAALLDQQVREPLTERELRAAIPALTAIEDEVSRKVQAQYEDMPYPRWVTAAPAGRTVPIDWYLHNQFPAAPIRNLGPREWLDVLIAGCGTGQHAIETAQRFAGADVLAIDLSRTSLGYARRKTEALGLTNVAYAQADILKLGALGRDFDLIEASGVLHHLSDPALGWRVLLSLLRPGGFMLVALYSALARTDIRAARAFIAERGYGSSADDIRRCRQEILRLPEADPLRNVTKYSDFFSTSECRDLLFHVQERDFTIPEIKAFLTAYGLTFIGFAGASAHLYLQRYPDDAAMTDLDRWHAIETEHPLSFVGMYQFWVQKA